MDKALGVLIAEVAARAGLTPEELIGRERAYVMVRGEAMSLARIRGFRMAQIAKAFGRSEAAVYFLINKYFKAVAPGRALPVVTDRAAKSDPLTPDEKAAILAGRRAGKPYSKIASELGRSLKTVENAGSAILKRESAPGGGKIEPAIAFNAKADERFVEAVMAQGGHPVGRSPIPPKPDELVGRYSKELIAQARGGAVLP